MHYRRLGDAGVKLSEIGLGGWLTFGNALEQPSGAGRHGPRRSTSASTSSTPPTPTPAADAKRSGASCSPGGGATGTCWRRRSYFPMGDGPNDRGLSRKHVIEQCHASLRRLRTDYIDLYQCHRFDVDTPLEETVRAMDDLIRQGKVLYWGFSEWTAEQIEQCLRICSDGGYYKPEGQPAAVQLDPPEHRARRDAAVPHGGDRAGGVVAAGAGDADRQVQAGPAVAAGQPREGRPAEQVHQGPRARPRAAGEGAAARARSRRSRGSRWRSSRWRGCCGATR